MHLSMSDQPSWMLFKLRRFVIHVELAILISQHFSKNRVLCESMTAKRTGCVVSLIAMPSMAAMLRFWNFRPQYQVLVSAISHAPWAV